MLHYRLDTFQLLLPPLQHVHRLVYYIQTASDSCNPFLYYAGIHLTDYK
jgi:hypothetical protein